MWMDHVGGVFVSLIFWTFVGAVIIVPQYFKYKDRQRMHDTLRVAFEKGQPVPPEVIEALQSNVADRLAPTAERDLRSKRPWLHLRGGRVWPILRSSDPTIFQSSWPVSSGGNERLPKSR